MIFVGIRIRRAQTFVTFKKTHFGAEFCKNSALILLAHEFIEAQESLCGNTVNLTYNGHEYNGLYFRPTKGQKFKFLPL